MRARFSKCDRRRRDERNDTPSDAARDEICSAVSSWSSFILGQAFVEGGSRQAAKGDWDACRFVADLRSYILTNRLSMLYVIFQIDQHDFAVRNRATLAEHPYDLDIPSWEARSRVALEMRAAAAR